MTDLGIGEDPDEEKRKTQEKHRKRIKKISKNIGRPIAADLTEEQKREVQRLEARDGKVVVKKDKDEDEDDKKTKAEKVLDAATANIKKLFVDEYQEPHAAYIRQ